MDRLNLFANYAKDANTPQKLYEAMQKVGPLPLFHINEEEAHLKEPAEEEACALYDLARRMAIGLRKANPDLPELPPTETDPFAGWEKIQEWCTDAQRVEGGSGEKVYIEIDLATHNITVGTTQHFIASNKVWMFIKILVEDKQHHKATPLKDGRINWKNARDMLRRKIGKTATAQMILCSKGCYTLDSNVVIKGTGQIGLRRTKS